MNYTVRRATAADVDAIFSLTSSMAESELMLSRSKYKIATMLPTFAVAEEESGAIIGCGSCSILWTDLAEICALAVRRDRQGQGVGAAVVAALVEESRRLRIPKIITLTYQVKFFEKMGFAVVDKDAFPRKVWRECLECPKLEACDETAMFRDI